MYRQFDSALLFSEAKGVGVYMVPKQLCHTVGVTDRLRASGGKGYTCTSMSRKNEQKINSSSQRRNK